ncbi:MAG: uracil-DNA glycosylase [Anaerohalosphaeraceae bacterium]|nr:uracil-DNA glycosylase [Anaerohalosphaeraceae bacterium]
MDNTIDFRKIAKQHIELEGFMAGFAKKSNAEADAAKSLEEIAKEVKACKECSLWESRANTVPGEGDSAARVVFVGEAPGADEDKCGLPFVGRSGKLLSDIIGAMGLRREDIYICNVIKCRPPGNRDPKPDEIASCIGFLKRQLDLIRPQVIVALGAHAAKTLLKTDKAIGRLRGKFHDFYFDDSLPPIKLMPTYHPSYLLRNYSQESRLKVWQDIQKVMAELALEVPEKKK